MTLLLCWSLSVVLSTACRAKRYLLSTYRLPGEYTPLFFLTMSRQPLKWDPGFRTSSDTSINVLSTDGRVETNKNDPFPQEKKSDVVVFTWITSIIVELETVHVCPSVTHPLCIAQ